MIKLVFEKIAKTTGDVVLLCQSCNDCFVELLRVCFALELGFWPLM